MSSATGFKPLLREAAVTADVEARLAKLTSLAGGELSYIETIQLDTALKAVSSVEQRTHHRLRLAIASSSTIDQLLPAIRVAGLRRQMLVDVRAGGFGQYRQEILGANSPFTVDKLDILLLSLNYPEFVGGVPLAASKDMADRAVKNAVADLCELWRAARRRFGCPVIQQSFLDTAPVVFGNHERLIPAAPSRLIWRLNDEVAEAAAAEGVFLLDVAAASARDGIDAWFDARHWLQGKMEIAPEAAARYAELLLRLIGAQQGRSKKCLVLDLDNTLWSGVIGDVGLDGIKLGQGSAVGEAHLALQKYAKQLNERGVILAVCSKNEMSIVDEAFDRHPEMYLKRSDISEFAVNWVDKAENLRAIAAKLNLGLDSLVFVDDNPAERARVRESLPMVAVPELPEDPAHYVRCIARSGYFEATFLTDEDTKRGMQYAANAEREALRGVSQSLDDFLAGLEMSVVYGSITSVDVARAAQLLNKTNQFNTTTRRSSVEQLEKVAANVSGMALQFRLIDRFGDNGLVSVMLFSASDSQRPEILELSNWVMSCRVFGRELEQEAMNIAVEQARARGFTVFEAAYVPTAKNAVIKDLFANLGFVRAASTEGRDSASRWTLDLATYETRSTHITRRTQA